MVALSFQKQFAPPILAGTKQHTIRGERKRPILQGQALELYTGMRTKHCWMIGTAACIGTVPVSLYFTRNTVVVGGAIYRGRKTLDDFARSDGFADWLEMCQFWEVPVFDGHLIRWVNFVAAPGRLP